MPTEKYLKRFGKIGLPKQLIVQDEKENSLRRKYPLRFRDFCEEFYRCLNAWPTNGNTWECYKEAMVKELGKKIMFKKTIEDFFQCFVKKEDLPEKEHLNIYQPDKPFKRTCPASLKARQIISVNPRK